MVLYQETAVNFRYPTEYGRDGYSISQNRIVFIITLYNDKRDKQND